MTLKTPFPHLLREWSERWGESEAETPSRYAWWSNLFGDTRERLRWTTMAVERLRRRTSASGEEQWWLGPFAPRRRTPPHSTPPLSMAVIRWSHRRTLTLAHHETQHHLWQNYPRRWLPRTNWSSLQGDFMADLCKRNLSLRPYRSIFYMNSNLLLLFTFR